MSTNQSSSSHFAPTTAAARKTGNCDGGPPVDGWIAEWAARHHEAQVVQRRIPPPPPLVRSHAVANLLPLLSAAPQAPTRVTLKMDVEAYDDDNDDTDADPTFQAPAADLEAAQHLTLIKLDGLTPREPSREERRQKRDIVREAAAAEAELRRHLGQQRRARLRPEPSVSRGRRSSVNQVIRQMLTTGAAAEPAIVLRRNDA